MKYNKFGMEHVRRIKKIEKKLGNLFKSNNWPWNLRVSSSFRKYIQSFLNFTTIFHIAYLSIG